MDKFDTPLNFDSILSDYLKGKLSFENNTLKGRLEVPEKDDIKRLPSLGSKDYENILSIGQDAIEKKEVGVIIIAGGMATRFSYNRPKAIFPILDGKTFLHLKSEDCMRWNVPLYVMTSFFSHDLITSLFDNNNFFKMEPENVQLFRQYKLPRIYRDGTVIRDEAGNIDYATSGHGDFLFAIKENGLLDDFINKGGKYLLFSNIDNLGATVNPAILGHHILSGKGMTVELAQKRRGDKGGAPCKVNDRLQLSEGFCFPKDFDQDAVNVFNTATYIFNSAVLKNNFNLPWYVVEKKAKGRNVIQFERLAGDMTVFVDANYLEIDRDERFLPVKTLDDVPYVRQILQEKLLYNT